MTILKVVCAILGGFTMGFIATLVVLLYAILTLVWCFIEWLDEQERLSWEKSHGERRDGGENDNGV
jgi:hypothetical protein